ncbi:dephospho-CoA kinase [Marinomonas ostreistagni]|uniref:dephospho-CoA kinase n=1 Tax=Marinomonas ostreistagni TaxID=359209 RepID=UPI00194FEED4|nr:dephospho-CoA kinase [Marinomonas ostreistagni]MBM6550262.1 dephospho-CoA kinase [Marinomonas ostreistagni]
MNSPKVVGLTGGIGSGKTTIAKLFQQQGIPFVDADDVAREVVAPGEPCLAQIVAHFGPDIVNHQGALDRAQLRRLIFDDPEQKAWLEALLHPIIRQRIVQHLQAAKGPYVLLVHPLLFEKQQQSLCDYTIAVSVPRSTQIERVIERDQNSAAQVERILATQLTDQERIVKADFILKNTSNHKDLSGKVLSLHEKLLELLA